MVAFFQRVKWRWQRRQMHLYAAGHCDATEREHCSVRPQIDTLKNTVHHWRTTFVRRAAVVHSLITFIYMCTRTVIQMKCARTSGSGTVAVTEAKKRG